MGKHFSDNLFDLSDYKESKSSKSYKSVGPSCHTTHPELSLGGGIVLGGSCLSPRDGFQVYIAFDSLPTIRKAWPWEKNRVENFQFKIQDMHAPSNTGDFKNMINWICNQLQTGTRIHMGCIGGHGRTGTVLSALVAQLGISEDAIGWVRKNHCDRAVESEEQVNFLVKHFGVKPVKATKSKSHKSKSHGFDFSNYLPGSGTDYSSYTSSTRVIRPVAAKKKSIWR